MHNWKKMTEKSGSKWIEYITEYLNNRAWRASGGLSGYMVNLQLAVFEEFSSRQPKRMLTAQWQSPQRQKLQRHERPEQHWPSSIPRAQLCLIEWINKSNTLLTIIVLYVQYMNTRYSKKGEYFRRKVERTDTRDRRWADFGAPPRGSFYGNQFTLWYYASFISNVL